MLKRRLTALFIFALLFSFSSISTADDNPYKINYQIEFASNQFVVDQLNDYEVIRGENHTYLNEVGAPMLPSERVKIAVPADMKAVSVKLVSSSQTVFREEINIFASQPPLEIGRSTDDLKMVEQIKDIYQSSTPYPQNIVKLIRQSDLAGQSFVELEVYPIQYIPSEKRAILYTKLEIIIEGICGNICGDYLPNSLTEKERSKYLKRLYSQIDNPQSISPSSSSPGLKSVSSLPSSTQFDHVIITSQYVAAGYAPLVEWNTRRGVRDTVITTDYIYANYAGVVDKEQIRNFIIDAHQNWGATYFLLGGEHTMVPFEYRTYNGTSIPSDAYYADYDDDWEYEVYVGRCTGDTFEQIERFVNKVIKYQTDPPDLGYLNRSAMLGMDLTLATQAPYYTLTRTEWLKDSIVTTYMPSDLLVSKIYDSQGGDHREDFLAALNNGSNLINHSDHSNRSIMGAGDLNHGGYISSYDVPYLTNYHKYVNIVSLGCYPNQLDFDDCIAEHLVIRSDSTGAVSFTGNTRSGWFYVGDPFSLSSAIDLQWWIGLFEQGYYNLGEALAYSKSAADIENVWPFSEWTFNLLGDPAMPLWTDNWSFINVAHDVEIDVVPQTFEVTVTRTDGAFIPDVNVCLWKGDEIYLVGSPNSEGIVSFDIDPQTRGEIKVTITGYNYKPYFGTVQVIGNEPPQCVIPGDTTIFQCAPEEVSLPVGCVDNDGNLLSGPDLVRGPGELVGNDWRYTPIGNETIEISIVCQDSLGYSCESTFFVTFQINEVPSLTVPADTAIIQLRPGSELVFPVTISDDNISSCLISSGPGTLGENDWSYAPADDESIAVTIRLDDECGLYDEASFNIEYDLYFCGDANDNGETNILDITFLIAFLYSSGQTPSPIMAGDATNDGTINILDITMLIAYLYQDGSAPVCE